MANMRIIARNWADSANLTANPVLPAATPINNLKSSSRSKLIRSAGYTAPGDTQEILGNLLPAQTISAIVLGRHNLATGTEVTLTLYSDLDQVTPIGSPIVSALTVDEAGGEILPWGGFIYGSISWGLDKLAEEYTPKANWVYWYDTPITNVQSFKIAVSLTAREIEIGRLFIGEYIEPTYNLSFGHQLSWIEKTKQYRTDGGSLRSDISIPTRKLQFDIGTMSEEDRAKIQRNMRYVGLRKDLYISLFPEDNEITKQKDYSGIMKLTKIPSMQEYVHNYYKSKYVMEEV